MCAGLSIFFSGSLAVLLLYTGILESGHGYGSAFVIGSRRNVDDEFFSGLVEIETALRGSFLLRQTGGLEF